MPWPTVELEVTATDSDKAVTGPKFLSTARAELDGDHRRGDARYADMPEIVQKHGGESQHGELWHAQNADARHDTPDHPVAQRSDHRRGRHG